MTKPEVARRRTLSSARWGRCSNPFFKLSDPQEWCPTTTRRPMPKARRILETPKRYIQSVRSSPAIKSQPHETANASQRGACFTGYNPAIPLLT